MNTELAILVPALNEKPRIAEVLQVICGYSTSQRVVVIDDGSEDDTATVARQFPVELVSFETNRGKGAALQAGIDHVGKADYWIFVDADLINLQHYHITELLKPLQQDPELAMTVGVFRGGATKTDLAHRYFGILNGQRGLSQKYIEDLPDLSWSRFGVEILLSKYAARQNYRVAHPYLKELTHHTKEAKYGFAKGFPYRLQMYRECLYSLSSWHKHCPEKLNRVAPPSV